MTKFTTADFLAAADDAQSINSTAPKRLIIPPPTLRLPVAPPSPLFDGVNTHINTEAFPEYVDAPELNSDTEHCSLDCSHMVCFWVSHSRCPPECCCEEEDIEPAPYLTKARLLPTSTIDVDQETIRLATDILGATDLEDTIELHFHDAQMILSKLETYIMYRSPRMDMLGEKLDCFFPDEGDQEAMSVFDFFFTTMRMYVLRTLRSSEPRVLTVKDLTSELHVYMWTMTREYIAAYAMTHPWDEVEDVGPWTVFDIDATKAPGMVSFFWKICTRDIIALFTLQSIEIEEGLEDDSDEWEDCDSEWEDFDDEFVEV